MALGRFRADGNWLREFRPNLQSHGGFPESLAECLSSPRFQYLTCVFVRNYCAVRNSSNVLGNGTSLAYTLERQRSRSVFCGVRADCNEILESLPCELRVPPWQAPRLHLNDRLMVAGGRLPITAVVCYCNPVISVLSTQTVEPLAFELRRVHDGRSFAPGNEREVIARGAAPRCRQGRSVASLPA